MMRAGSAGCDLGAIDAADLRLWVAQDNDRIVLRDTIGDEVVHVDVDRRRSEETVVSGSFPGEPAVALLAVGAALHFC